MTIFPTFAICAIAFYLVAVMMRPSGGVTGMGEQLAKAVQDVIGHVIPDPITRWLASLIASLLLLLIPITLLFHRNFRNPLGADISYGEFLTSVAVSEAIFGILFGLMFAYWFRGLLLTDSKEGLKSKEIIISIIMVILLLLGIGGQNVLANLFDRLTGLEVAGTKIAFAEAHAQIVTASVNLASRADTPAQSAGAPDTSKGLEFLAAIDTFIGKDASFVALVNGKPVDWGETAAFAKDAVSKPARCLLDYVSETGDSSRVAEILTYSAAHIGSAIRLDSTDDVSDSIKDTALKIDDFFQPFKSSKPCRALSSVVSAVEEHFDASGAGDGWRGRPYIWLAAASMFAFGHHYPPAIALLDQWTQALDGNTQIHPVHLPPSEATRTIYEIRVRSVMSAFIEEWIRYSPSSKTVAVLSYHLSNLQKLLDALNSLSVVEKDLQKVRSPRNSLDETAFASAPDDRRLCPLLPPQSGQDKATLSDEELAHVRLLETFISTKALWITTALDHPEYTGQFEAQAHKYIDDLLSIDLSCSRLVAGPEPKDRSNKQPATDRAEMLHLVARIALVESGDPQTRQVAEPDRARLALRKARQAVELGLQIIKPFKNEATRSARDVAFLDQIAGDQAVTDYDDLIGDQTKLDAAIAR